MWCIDSKFNIAIEIHRHIAKSLLPNLILYRTSKFKMNMNSVVPMIHIVCAKCKLDCLMSTWPQLSSRDSIHSVSK